MRVFPFDKETHNSKFFWLSSLGKPNGAGASNWLHATVPNGQKINGRVWLTEGSLKADIASHYIKAPFFAVPGTSGSKDILDALAKTVTKKVTWEISDDKPTVTFQETVSHKYEVKGIAGFLKKMFKK